MSATLDTLLVAPAVADVMARILGRLQGRGLVTTDWLDGGPERTFVESYSAVLADVYQSQKNIASGGWVELAVAAGLSDWLDFLGNEFYGLPRNGSVSTLGTMPLACAASAGPYTINPGDLRALSSSGNVYTNSTGGVLVSGGTLPMTWQAEQPGASYNDGNGTITQLQTPLPGVSISSSGTPFSPPVLLGSGVGTIVPSGTVAPISWGVLITFAGVLGTARFKLSQDNGQTFGAEHTVAGGGVNANIDGSGLTLTFANAGGNPAFSLNDLTLFSSPGSWITTPGKDAEADADYGARMTARWPSLSAVPTRDKYELWAFAAAPDSITRVFASASPTTTATISIVLAGPAGAVQAGVCNQVKAYIQGPRAGLTVVVSVVSAGAQPLNVGGTIVVVASRLAAAQQAVQAAIQKLVAVVPIGGFDVGGGGNVLPWSMVASVIEDVDGIRSIKSDFGITGAATTDQPLTSTQVVTYTQDAATAFTWITVAE